VTFSTSSRTKPNALRRSRPGRGRFHQRGGKQAVLFIAIGRGGARFGGIGDQGIRTGRLDLGQPSRDRALRHGVLHRLKRIIAARIQDDQTQLLCRLDHRQDTIERDRFVIGVDIAFQHGIDRNEIVDAFDLNAVPGAINDRHIGVPHLVGEIAKSAAHLIGFEIALEGDDIEPRALEHRSHRAGVVRRIGEQGDVLIGRIAKHQRDPLLGEGGLAQKPHRANRHDKS
jgi:hypothetical protein